VPCPRDAPPVYISCVVVRIEGGFPGAGSALSSSTSQPHPAGHMGCRRAAMQRTHRPPLGGGSVPRSLIATATSLAICVPKAAKTVQKPSLALLGRQNSSSEEGGPRARPAGRQRSRRGSEAKEQLGRPAANRNQIPDCFTRLMRSEFVLCWLKGRATQWSGGPHRKEKKCLSPFRNGDFKNF
jgi:hypothetical protein